MGPTLFFEKKKKTKQKKQPFKKKNKFYVGVVSHAT